MDEVEHIAEVSQAERYVATLFLQCREIANFFEAPEADKVQRPVPIPPPTPPPVQPKHIEEDDSFLGGVESDSSSDSSSDSAGSAGSLHRRQRHIISQHRPPPAPPPAPGRPRKRPESAGALFRPGPWSDANYSEASRLKRILFSPSWRPSPVFRRKPPRERPQRKEVHKAMSRRSSISSVASLRSGHGGTPQAIPRRERRSSVWSIQSAELPPELKALHEGHTMSRVSLKTEQDDVQSTTTARTDHHSIFALPEEKDDEVDSKRRQGMRGRRGLSMNLRRYQTSRTRSSTTELDRSPTGRSLRSRGSKSRLTSKVRKSVQQVNRDMEESFLRRFRTAKEDGLATAAPDTSEQVMSLHQLAISVNVSFDDARLIKAAFDLFASGKDSLEYGEFVQAVLHLHRTMNSACTATTLSQCETLCAMTFPGGGLDGTVDLLKLLQWYSTYSFQEELILSAEMRTLRRLSRKYGVPWEEVDNVKRQFDNVDEDGSGDITFEEFSDVLRRVLQVPQNLDLPVNRVRHFWKELDHDGSGKADFTEFLPWWLKYFHNKEGRKMLVKPFEDFYRNVRNLKNPDPPPYRKGKKVVTAASGAPSKKDHFQEINNLARGGSGVFARGVSGGSMGFGRQASAGSNAAGVTWNLGMASWSLGS